MFRKKISIFSLIILCALAPVTSVRPRLGIVLGGLGVAGGLVGTVVCYKKMKNYQTILEDKNLGHPEGAIISGEEAGRMKRELKNNANFYRFCMYGCGAVTIGSGIVLGKSIYDWYQEKKKKEKKAKRKKKEEEARRKAANSGGAFKFDADGRCVADAKGGKAVLSVYIDSVNGEIKFFSREGDESTFVSGETIFTSSVNALRNQVAKDGMFQKISESLFWLKNKGSCPLRPSFLKKVRLDVKSAERKMKKGEVFSDSENASLAFGLDCHVKVLLWEGSSSLDPAKFGELKDIASSGAITGNDSLDDLVRSFGGGSAGGFAQSRGGGSDSDSDSDSDEDEEEESDSGDTDIELSYSDVLFLILEDGNTIAENFPKYLADLDKGLDRGCAIKKRLRDPLWIGVDGRSEGGVRCVNGKYYFGYVCSVVDKRDGVVSRIVFMPTRRAVEAEIGEAQARKASLDEDDEEEESDSDDTHDEPNPIQILDGDVSAEDLPKYLASLNEGRDVTEKMRGLFRPNSVLMGWDGYAEERVRKVDGEYYFGFKCHVVDSMGKGVARVVFVPTRTASVREETRVRAADSDEDEEEEENSSAELMDDRVIYRFSRNSNSDTDFELKKKQDLLYGYVTSELDSRNFEAAQCQMLMDALYSNVYLTEKTMRSLMTKYNLKVIDCNAEAGRDGAKFSGVKVGRDDSNYSIFFPIKKLDQ